MFNDAVLRWMNDLSAQGIFITDTELRIREWNRWLEIHSGRSALEMVGQHLFDAYPELLERGVHKYYEEVLAGQVRFLSHRLHHYLLPMPPQIGDTGIEKMQQSARIAPLMVDDQIIGTITVIDDVTERSAREDQLVRLLRLEKEAREEAEAANRTKDEFLATVSHELRTPLHAIFGWIQILRDADIGAQSFAHGLETIERNVRAQIQIVEDILDVSRVITGKLNLEVRQVDLINIIDLALDTMRLAAEAKEIQLQLMLGSEPALVSGDSNRLQQVVWNLLSNAIKFTPKGGTIRVQLKRSDSQFEIIVQDTGKGIKPEFLPFVFERFRQADSSSTRKHTGLGLGLAIVRHLVEMHGGSIQATSSGEGQGATFTISLPRMAVNRMESVAMPSDEQFPETDAEPAFVFEKDAGLQEVPKLKGLPVLIVDDDADSREMLDFALMRYGAESRTAASTQEAVEILEQWTPAVLVSDIGMPDEDGYSLINHIRKFEEKHGRQIPAIALTGYTGKLNQERLLSAGFQIHLPKPVDIDQLAIVIADLAGISENDLSSVKTSIQ